MEKTKNEPVNCSFFGKNFKKKRMNKDKYLAKYNAVFDQLDLVRIPSGRLERNKQDRSGPRVCGDKL